MAGQGAVTVLLVGFLLPVVAVSAVLCGHVGEAWPPGVWWRAWRRRPRTPPANLPFPALIAARRRPQPSWALPGDTEALSASPTPESEKEPNA